MQLISLFALLTFVICLLYILLPVNCQQTNKLEKTSSVLNDLRIRLARLKNLLSQSTSELKSNFHQNRHLDIEVISQTAWINFYTERLAKVNQRTIKPVELHLLQEALLHRENRLEEELDILRKVQQSKFRAKLTNNEALLEHIQDRLVKYLEVYKKVPDVYRYVVWGAVDELKHMVEEIKGQNDKAKKLSVEKMAEYEQMVKRVDETMKSLIRYRIWSVVHDREFYN